MGTMTTAAQARIYQLVHQAIHQGRLSRCDHLTLVSAMLADATLDPLDRSQINRVFDYVRMGRVRLVD
ncbi:hypothetical protein [Halomicronema hongdechloris]|nr:hypothetical protein [Halomicronema hongdechloris]